MGREKRFWEMFSDGKFCEATLELARAGAIKKKRKKRETERDTTVVRVWWKKPGPVHGSASVFVIVLPTKEVVERNSFAV